jgi:cellulose biosynthesis protein BcsQ
VRTPKLTAAPCHDTTLRALDHVLDTVTQAQAFTPGLRTLGIVPSIVGTCTLHRDEALAELDKRWPGLRLPPLPRRVALEDAAAGGQPITADAPESASAAAVRALAQEVLASTGSTLSLVGEPPAVPPSGWCSPPTSSPPTNG